MATSIFRRLAILLGCWKERELDTSRCALDSQPSDSQLRIHFLPSSHEGSRYSSERDVRIPFQWLLLSIYYSLLQVLMWLLWSTMKKRINRKQTKTSKLFPPRTQRTIMKQLLDYVVWQSPAKEKEERHTALVWSKSVTPGGTPNGIPYPALMRLFSAGSSLLTVFHIPWLSRRGESSSIVFFSHILRTTPL